ncbi:cytochrome c oxidase subunit 2A [Pseudogracilibacillus sp. SE30717A]
MAKPVEKEQQVEQHDNYDLRGTLFSVIILAAIILISWLGVWYLFISR